MKHPARYNPIVAAGLWLAFLNTASIADSNIKGWDELVSIYYQLEVVNYCGLGNQQVVDGFKLINDQILDQFNINPKQIDSARAAAWKAGYAEWDNRGLGGFRRWCANEGASYVEYFIEVSDQAGLKGDKNPLPPCRSSRQALKFHASFRPPSRNLLQHSC